MDNKDLLVPSNITITYVDSNSSTIDTKIYCYNYTNGTWYFMDVDSRSGDNSFSFNFTDINNTRLHKIVLYFNNSANFDVNSPVTLSVPARHVYTTRTPFDLDDRIQKIVGPAPFGDNWTIFISVFLSVIMLCLFGVYNAGLGIIGAGLSLGLTNAMFSFWQIGSINASLLVVAGFIVFIGIMYMLSKPGGTEDI